MNLQFPRRRIPIAISGAVILATWLAQSLPLVLPHPRKTGESQFSLFQRLEWMTYDWRIRLSSQAPQTVANNLGFVFISDASIARLADGSLGCQFGLYWPRQVYGRLVRELANQGARAIGIDVLLGELRPDHPPVVLPDQSLVESDDFLAGEMRRASNVVLASTRDLVPAGLFRTNAAALGDISASKDSDGITRRIPAYTDYRILHPALRDAVRVERTLAVFELDDGRTVDLPIDQDGTFDLQGLGVRPLPGGSRRQKAVTRLRVWNLGLRVAARELGIDLDRAVVDLPRGRILLNGPGELTRVIPIDEHGRFFNDWSLPVNAPQLTQEDIVGLLEQDAARQNDRFPTPSNRWQGKLVFVGSTASGNDLTDRGATPLAEDTFLVSAYWNAANALLTDRFITPPSYRAEFFLILALGVVAALLAWNLRALPASITALVLLSGYLALSVWLFVQHRYWLPLTLPLLGAFLLTHVSLVTYRAMFEQGERQRVKSVFARIVSPDIVNELLQAEKIELGGARREVTVFFSDVRGFTELTDQSQGRAETEARSRNLSAQETEALFDQHAREDLDTVNPYLATVADTVKLHHGTLDKYIGDCVMAFWGAPVANPRHAVTCVQAAIDTQRRIAVLNEQRRAENARRLVENTARAQRGESPRPLLPLLNLGTGINTGKVTVGLMGSDQHGLNYTVFGRAVNLASRLEGLSGNSRIVIGQTTFEALKSDAPDLASSCIALPPATIKGFRDVVPAYEVPWRSAPAPT